jgi:hypothetical protein
VSLFDSILVLLESFLGEISDLPKHPKLRRKKFVIIRIEERAVASLVMRANGTRYWHESQPAGSSGGCLNGMKVLVSLRLTLWLIAPPTWTGAPPRL